MAVVGHDEDIVHVPQRMVVGQGFLIEGIQVGAGDSTLLERCYQRRFVDDLTTPEERTIWLSACW